MSIGRFYAGIGGLVRFPPQNAYLLLKRSPEKDYAAGEWECVTGHVDQGEGFEDAVRREIFEELGVEAQIEFIIGTTHFYRGPKTPANELVGVIYACAIDDPEAIATGIEHTESRWLTPAEAYRFLPDGSRIKAVIRRAEAVRALLPPALLDFNKTTGFELG